MTRSRSNAGFVVACVVLFLSAAGLGAVAKVLKFTKEAIYPPNGKQLGSLPTSTRSWIQVGRDHTETEEVESVLGTKNYVTRTYALKGKDGKPDLSGPAIQFHAAYYTGMIDTVPHVPDRCFVGGGMQLGGILGNLEMPLDRSEWRPDTDAPEHLKGRLWKVRTEGGLYPRLPRDPEKMRLRTMEFKSEKERPLYAGYFFVANGGTTPEAEGVRLLAFDLSTKYAYYMKVQVTSGSVNSGEELAQLGGGLINELMPELMLCVPDWVDVEQGLYPVPDNTGAAGEQSPKTGNNAGRIPG